MKKSIVCGDIEIAFTSNFEYLWCDRGSGNNRDVAIWKPIPPEGFSFLGSLGVNGYDPVNGIQYSLCVKNAENFNTPAIVQPDDFELIWSENDSGADDNGSCWAPVPPKGYSALGAIFVGGYDKPNKDCGVVCVRDDYTCHGVIGDSFWDTIMLPIRISNVSVVSFVPVEIPDNYNIQDGWIACPNTFVLSVVHEHDGKSYKKPDCNCLKLPFSCVTTDEKPTIPVVHGREKPSSTQEVLTNKLFLPFTAFRSDSIRMGMQWTIDNSPFYTLEKWESYDAFIYGNNNTGSQQTENDEVTIGISDESSRSFEEKTSVTVSAQAGIAFKGSGVSVSKSITNEMGWGESSSRSVFERQTINRTLIVIENTSCTLFVGCSKLKIRRGDGSYLGDGLAFYKNEYIFTQFP